LPLDHVLRRFLHTCTIPATWARKANTGPRRPILYSPNDPIRRDMSGPPGVRPVAFGQGGLMSPTACCNRASMPGPAMPGYAGA